MYLLTDQSSTIGCIDTIMLDINSPSKILNTYFFPIFSHTDQTSTIGCIDTIMLLSCTNPTTTINITNAIYGKYATPCASCCPADSENDCTQPLQDVSPEDWAYLLFLCQNKTSCTYEYEGQVIDGCEENYIADYMQVFYSCEGEDEGKECNDYSAW